MMLTNRIYDVVLLALALAVAFGSGHILVDTKPFLIALLSYWLFSSFYHNQRIFYKSHNINIDYGVSFSPSFVLFAGPFGLLVFEILYRFTVYFNKKRTKTADPEEFMDTLYNIASFVLSNSAGFYLFQLLSPFVQSIPLGFWLLIFASVYLSSLLSSVFLTAFLLLTGNIQSRKDAFTVIFTNRTLVDVGKIAFTNGLLLYFLLEGNWEMLLGMFILNDLVSRSFYSKSQSIQNKTERDQFEKMAYTDFLTGTYNRAFMAKKMDELNQSDETIGIVVADIDKFKQFNDTYNHAVGDVIIQHFAATLKNHLQKGDLLFRTGGEEFTIFLRHRSYAQCNETAEDILAGLQNSTVGCEYNAEPLSLCYTASLGLYYFNVGVDTPLEKGYVCADQLLLQSKQLGRNRVTAKNGLDLGIQC
ncbi:GGDEF domain-containing protein [Brevibacillus migulae]|uniref:GGDEF domain-containing protein n=1 Tax=Brevibacillus migulae TaxID=1644114 RepID=UPI001F323D68|nr:GGDEF domain-containing protein [Brevibacillus migulae]